MKWVPMSRVKGLSRDKGGYQMPVEPVFSDFNIHTAIRCLLAVSNLIFKRKAFC